MALALDHAERPRAARQQVHAPVFHLLEHLLDRHRAADVAQPVVGEPDDPELALGLQALADHRLVALLEDVQRNQLAGQRDEPQREQRKLARRAFGHAPVQSTAGRAGWSARRATSSSRL